MQEMLEEAGIGGYLALISASLGWLAAVAMVALAVPKRSVRGALIAAGLAMGFGVAAMSIGRWGEVTSVRGSLLATAFASREDRATIMEGARREAAQATRLGLMGGAPLVLLALAVMGASLARFPRRA